MLAIECVFLYHVAQGPIGLQSMIGMFEHRRFARIFPGAIRALFGHELLGRRHLPETMLVLLLHLQQVPLDEEPHRFACRIEEKWHGIVREKRTPVVVHIDEASNDVLNPADTTR